MGESTKSDEMWSHTDYADDATGMQEASRQLPLFRPQHTPDYALEPYLANPDTADILATFTTWMASDENRLAVCGPRACGKTYLITVIKILTTPSAISIIDRYRDYLPPGFSNEVRTITALDFESIDDALHHVRYELSEDYKNRNTLYLVDNLKPDPTHPRRLFDLIEECRSAEVRLMLAGSGQPADWAGSLPDLHTRLEAMPRLCIGAPSELAMDSLLSNQLRARQFAISDDDLHTLSTYAARRLPRTFEAVADFVEALDLAVLEEARKPSIPLARKILGGEKR